MVWKIAGLVGAAVLAGLLCKRLMDVRRARQTTRSAMELERKKLLTELRELDRQLAGLPDDADTMPLQKRRLKLKSRLDRLG